MQPENAGTEHLEQEDVLQETVENPEDQVQAEEVQDDHYIRWMRDHPA